MNENRIIVNVDTTLERIRKLERQNKILVAAIKTIRKASGMECVEDEKFLCFRTKMPLTPDEAVVLYALDKVMEDIHAERKLEKQRLN